MPEHPVIVAAERFRAQLLRMEREQAMRYVRAYGQIVRGLQGQIAGLAQEIAALETAPTAGQVLRMERWLALERQMIDEVARFGAFVDTDLQGLVEERIALGLQQAEQLTLAGMPEPVAAALRVTWNRLPVEAVQALMGWLAPGSPLRESLVSQLGPAVADQVGQALLRGLALGWNPRKVASAMNKELGQGLTWSLRTARTAQLYAYREASRAAFAANGQLVEGWTWHCARDERSCMSCIVQHGSFHTWDEILNDHHNGRCAMIPVTKTWAELGFEGIPDTNPVIEPGREWFDRLSDAQQQKYMGGATWRAWRAGKVQWEDLSREHPDQVYGMMRTMPSLKELLGDDARQFYRR